MSMTSFSSPAKPATASRRRVLLAALAVGLGAPAATSALAQSAEAVSLETARAELEAGRVTLIDVREPAEHAGGVAPGARLLPMSQIGRRLAEIPTDPARPVLLICNTQNRSRSVLRALRERGYRHVSYVSGGMSEWTRRGWPLVAPRH